MSNDVAVFVDPAHADSAAALYRGHPQHRVERDDQIIEVLENAEPGLIVLHGADDLVSRVLSVWHVDRSRRGSQAVFAAAPVSDHAHAAGATGRRTGLGTFGKALRKAIEGSFDATSVPTLSVSDSGLAFRRVAFSVGFGLFATGGFRNVAELAEQALEARRDDFRWAVDGTPQPNAAFLVASSLPKAWGGLAMGRGTSYRAGNSIASLATQTTRVGRAFSRVSGAAAAMPFNRIHIDGASGYLLDGIELSMDAPGVVELRAGPKPKFLQW
jgi:hypothetical protein